MNETLIYRYLIGVIKLNLDVLGIRTLNKADQITLGHLMDSLWNRMDQASQDYIQYKVPSEEADEIITQCLDAIDHVCIAKMEFVISYARKQQNEENAG